MVVIWFTFKMMHCGEDNGAKVRFISQLTKFKFAPIWFLQLIILEIINVLFVFLIARDSSYGEFLVSGYGWACQQEISLVLAKTPPIHYGTVIERSAITWGSCVFNACEHRVSHDTSVRRRNLRAWQMPRDDFGFLDWNIYFHKGCNYYYMFILTSKFIKKLENNYTRKKIINLNFAESNADRKTNAHGSFETFFFFSLMCG